jgi:hypothetical protein
MRAAQRAAARSALYWRRSLLLRLLASRHATGKGGDRRAGLMPGDPERVHAPAQRRRLQAYSCLDRRHGRLGRSSAERKASRTEKGGTIRARRNGPAQLRRHPQLSRRRFGCFLTGGFGSKFQHRQDWRLRRARPERPSPNRIGHPGRVAQWESALFTRGSADVQKRVDFPVFVRDSHCPPVAPIRPNRARSGTVWAAERGSCPNRRWAHFAARVPRSWRDPSCRISGTSLFSRDHAVAVRQNRSGSSTSRCQPGGTKAGHELPRGEAGALCQQYAPTSHAAEHVSLGHPADCADTARFTPRSDSSTLCAGWR